MFSKRWQTSPRAYDVVHDHDIEIPVSAGFALDCDVFRPNSSERFPVILCMFPFKKEMQFESVVPAAISPERVMVEGGDPNFYVRRGYVQVFCNVRGTGKSGGTFDHMGPGTTQDTYDAIEWLAVQPWCDGQVATFGTSYFAMTAKRVAALKPPSLKTIFAPFAAGDQYRDAIFHGGIFSFRFHRHRPLAELAEQPPRGPKLARSHRPAGIRPQGAACVARPRDRDPARSGGSAQQPRSRRFHAC